MTYTSTNYEVDGDTMERRSSSSVIVGLVSGFIYNEGADSALLQAGQDQGKGKDGAVALFSHSNAADSAADTDKEHDKRGNASVLSYFLRPYCSSSTYVVILHAYASFLHKHLLYECTVHMQFSEWGALLFHKEVYACIQVFERAAEAINAHGSDVASLSVACRGGGGSCSSSPRKSALSGEGELTGIRARFTMLIWILKLLTLDRVGDVGRYKIPSLAFAAHQQDMADILAHLETRKSTLPTGTILLERFLRAVLGRRTDFPPEAISKVKLQIL